MILCWNETFGFSRLCKLLPVHFATKQGYRSILHFNQFANNVCLFMRTVLLFIFRPIFPSIFFIFHIFIHSVKSPFFEKAQNLVIAFQLLAMYSLAARFSVSLVVGCGFSPCFRQKPFPSQGMIHHRSGTAITAARYFPRRPFRLLRFPRPGSKNSTSHTTNSATSPTGEVKK